MPTPKPLPTGPVKRRKPMPMPKRIEVDTSFLDAYADQPPVRLRPMPNASMAASGVRG